MEKYIGEYFLSIENEKINDNEFEDIVSELLNAIGFEVLKKGHSKKGEFCDGVIKFDDYAIVYDCKNSNNYMATAESNNTLKKYIDDEELRLKSEIYMVLILPNH